VNANLHLNHVQQEKVGPWLPVDASAMTKKGLVLNYQQR